MDTPSYSRLLSYLVCEMTMPTKKHVYNFAVSDKISMNPQLLAAASLTASSELKTDELINNTYMSGLQKETDGKLICPEIGQEELCEGTEIEKSALGDILNCESYGQSVINENTNTHISTLPRKRRPNQDCGITHKPVVEEKSTINTPTESKRRLCSMMENQISPTQSVSVKVKEEISDEIESTKRIDESEDATVSNVSKTTDSGDSTFYSDPLLLCSESDFKAMFRVSRSTFQILVKILSEEELEPIENVPLYKKVLIVLWLLGTAGSYKNAAQVFEVSEEAVSSCFFDICATLYNKSESFIKWPSASEADEIASRIEKNFGFPGVVGVLGCNYFTISIPKETLSRREHFNGKLRTYCVALQLVCDDGFVIRDIFPGLPGGIRPAQILRDSSLGELLTTQPTELIDSNKHILARSEFPQLKSMLTPYIKDSESLSKDEEEFNILHENVCLLVDQTFQMLKDRFQILKLLDPEVATMVLVTTCVLHNICIQSNDTYDPDENA